MAALTEEQRATVIEAVRSGMAIDMAGKLVGISASTFRRLRIQDPTLERDVYAALSQWDREMLSRERDAVEAGDADTATKISSLRQRRLPQYYSTDFRIRRIEDHSEDAAEEAPASSDSAIDAIEAILEARKGGKL